MASDRKPTSAPKHLADVLGNITDPLRWINKDRLVHLIQSNPSLRGFVYGYASEDEFVHFLESLESVDSYFKDDDHKKTKSDCTFVFKGREYTVQLKSLQTNSIKELEPGKFAAKIQNDASDRRKVTLPNGHVVETTCYVVGEYDILGVSLQPFTGRWEFAFKKNKNLKRTTSKKYTPDDQQFLLGTLEPIQFPLDASWTQDLTSLMGDTDLGNVIVVEKTRTEEVKIVEVPGSDAEVVIEEKNDSGRI